MSLIQPYPIWDSNTIIFLQNHFSGLVVFFKLISIIFAPPVIFIIAFLFFIFDQKQGVYYLVFFAIVTFFSFALKDICHQPRPYWSIPFVKAFITPRDYGMPSGHAMFATFYLWLALTYRKKLWVALPCILIFLLVCLSRMVLGAHFVSQILAGSLVGIIAAFSSYYIPKWLDASFNLKGKFIYITTLSIFILVVISYFYLEYGMYFQPKPEWVEMVAQYTPKPIHAISFTATAISFVLALSFFFSLAIEINFINFKFSGINMGIILNGIVVGLAYLILLGVITVLSLLISPVCALFVNAILFPIIVCLCIPLEGCRLGLLKSGIPISHKISRYTISYWLKM